MEGSFDKSEEPLARVIVWSLPRTLSTVLTKCVSFIDGIEVVLEPYGYAHASCLAMRTIGKKELPTVYNGNEALFEEAAQYLGAFTRSKIEPTRLPYATVQEELESMRGKYIFVKDQSHAMLPQFRQFIPKGFRHVFLIRDPSSIFVSYRKAIYKQAIDLKMLDKPEEEFDIVADDVIALEPMDLYRKHHSLWQHVQEHYDPNPIVVDTTDVLSNPAKHIKALMGALNLPYSDALLRWPSSTDTLKFWKTPGEGILDSHINFYGTAMRSTCFLPPSNKPSTDKLTSDIIRCVEASTSYYEEMSKAKMA